MTRPRPKLHDAFTTDQHGPCIVAQVKATTPGTCAVLTWRGKCVWLFDYELRPLPTKQSDRFPNISVPDYRVEGVGEIVSLAVDLMIEPPRRIKSPLYPLLSKIEQAGDL